MISVHNYVIYEHTTYDHRVTNVCAYLTKHDLLRSIFLLVRNMLLLLLLVLP